MTAAHPAITVVVMGYANASTITEAISSLLEQRCTDGFEVVVVTSGDDGSGDLVRVRFPELALVESRVRLLPGGARNAGVAAASGGIVAFLAADCTAEPGWIEARLRAHRAGHRVVASAVTIGEPRRPAAAALHFDLFGTRLPGRPAGIVAHTDPAAHGCSFDRDLLDRIGPFRDDVPIGEDTIAVERLSRLGVPVWFEPRVRTAHRGPRHLRGLVTDRFRRGLIAGNWASPAPEPMSMARAVLGFPARYGRGLRRTVRVCWRNGRGYRARLLVTLPWLAIGRAAGVAGWYWAQLRRAR